VTSGHTPTRRPWAIWVLAGTIVVLASQVLLLALTMRARAEFRDEQQQQTVAVICKVLGENFLREKNGSQDPDVRAAMDRLGCA